MTTYIRFIYFKGPDLSIKMKAKKGIIGRVKDSFAYQEMSRAGRVMYNSPRHAISALGLASFLATVACSSDSPTQPHVNKPATSEFYVTPTSGVAPVQVHIQGRCDAEAGIANYNIMVNGNQISVSNPIDTTVTRDSTSSFNLNCKDMDGNYANKGPLEVQVMHPSVQQNASLQNFIDIKYTADMQNMTKAARKMFRNDTLILTDTITGPTYAQTIPGNVAGQYMFVSGSDTARVNVPRYAPTLDTSGINAGMNEDGQTGFNLGQRMQSRNVEGNPVHLASATSLDGKTNVTVSGDSVTMTALGDSTGPYKVQFNIRSADGNTASAVIQDSIYDIPRISGILQDVETQAGVQGTLRAYTVNGADTTALPVRTADNLGNIVTNPDGSYSFRINQRSSSLEGILVMAREGTPGNYTGYVRTIPVPAKDTSGLVMRAVSNPGFTTPDTFTTFVQQLAGDIPSTKFDFNGQYIPGFMGFQGIEILSQNPFGSQYGTFDSTQQNFMKAKILDPNDINGLVRNRLTSNDIVLGNLGHFKLDSTNMKVIPDSGWIVVVPYSNLMSPEFGSVGLTDSYKTGTLEYGATIYLLPGAGSNGRIVSHEFGHTFTGPGHPTVIPGQTVMNLSTALQTTGQADRKAGAIIYEPTFMTSQGGSLAHVDYLGNILRPDFK